MNKTTRTVGFRIIRCNFSGPSSDQDSYLQMKFDILYPHPRISKIVKVRCYYHRTDHIIFVTAARFVLQRTARSALHDFRLRGR